MQNLKVSLNTLQNDEIGLPPLNSNQMRYFRTLKRVKMQNKMQNGEIENPDKESLAQSMRQSGQNNMFEPMEDQIKFVTLEGKELMKK